MRKIITIILGGFFLLVLLAPVSFAASSTIIPEVNKDYATLEDCDTMMNEVETYYAEHNAEFTTFMKEGDILGTVIACSIKTGRVHLYLVPYFLRYLAEFGIGIAGTVSMLFIVIGGFQYLTGPITQNKEQGKKTLTYAIIGLILSLSAWIIVNIVQVFVTS